MNELGMTLLIGVPCLLWLGFIVWMGFSGNKNKSHYVQRDATHRASWTTSAMQNEMENGQ